MGNVWDSDCGTPRWSSNLVQCSSLSVLLLASPSQLLEGVQQLIVRR